MDARQPECGKRKRRTFKEKQDWILAWLDKRWEIAKRTHWPPGAPHISSSDEETEESWHREFGGYRRYYTMGGHVSPDFAKTLREMYENGILYRYTLGNQGARDGGYAMKTYSVMYCYKRHVHEAKTLSELPPPEWVKNRA